MEKAGFGVKRSNIEDAFRQNVPREVYLSWEPRSMEEVEAYERVHGKGSSCIFFFMRIGLIGSSYVLEIKNPDHYSPDLYVCRK